MAVLVQEGFDLYTNAINLSRRAGLLYTGSAANYSTAAGRFGGRSTYVNGFSGAWVIPVANPVQRATIGVATRRGTSTMSTAVVTFFNDLTPLITVLLTSTGFAAVVRGPGGLNGTILATATTSPIGAVDWAYLECELVRSETAGEVRVYVNGTKVIDLSGVNTGTQNINGFGCDGDRSSAFGQLYCYWDDFYATDTATRLGPSRIETLSPISDVTREWTPSSGANNFSRVAEQPTDGDTSYVSTAADRALDSYRFQALTTNPVKIHSVAATLIARIDDVTPRLVRTVTTRDGYVAYGPQVVMTPDYKNVQSAPMNEAIGTGSAWTKASVDAVSSGPQMTIPS